MTVNPLMPVSVSITASLNPVCDGDSVSFTATPVNGGSTPSYQWKVNGTNTGANSPTFTYLPANSDQVQCILTSNITCPTGNPATSNMIMMTVNSLMPVSVYISASENPVCNGTSVTFTAFPTNEGSAPSYQWQVNGINSGTNSSSFIYPPANNDLVRCILTSNISCPTGNPATSNTIMMVVNPPMTVSVSISSSANPICTGDSVTFNATPTNGGSSPFYQWLVNGANSGTNSPVYIYTPANNDQVQCILTSDIICATGNPAASNTITMTANHLMPVSVSISASANPVCDGTPVTYTATPINEGSTPSYQWKINGINSGTNSPSFDYTPANNDQVQCILTSDITCATGNPAASNTITMTVDSLMPVSVSIFASANPICTGTSVTLTATPTNGGSDPSYQWKVNETNSGTHSPSFSFIPFNADQVQCILTSDITCPTGNPALSNRVTFIVHPLPVPEISGADNLCEGVTGIEYTTQDGMTGYEWTISSGGTITAGTGSQRIYTDWNSTGSQYVTVIYTSQEGCRALKPDTLTVTVTHPPQASAGQDHNVNEDSPDTLSGQSTGGSGQFSYHWQPVLLLIDPDQQNAITLPLEKDTIFILTVTDLLTGCSSSDSIRLHIKHKAPSPDEDCIVVHNVITPDGDGYNDTWVIDCITDYPDNTVEIFNRWGNPVNRFERYDNTSNVWKGTNFKGELMPDGTYYYVLKIKNRISRSGWVYLRGGRK